MRKKLTLAQMAVRYIWSIIGIAALLALAVLLFGCQSPVVVKDKPDEPVVTTPVTNPDPVTIVIKNSLWETVKTVIVSDRSVTTLTDRGVTSREIVTDDYQQEIEAYNAETLDDFLRAYDAGQVPDIANAPPVNVYICNPVTYAVNWSAENIPRISLVENAAAWRHDSAGQILFIDHVPPPPVVLPPPSLYAFYAIYEVDNTTGDIVLEDHCGYLPDESFTGQWITDPTQGGWSSVDAYYQTILHAYQMDATVIANNVHVVTRQLYTEPTP